MAMDFDSLWRVIVNRLLQAYRTTDAGEFVFPASKQGALAYLNELQLHIEAMEEFDALPEGGAGVILFAILWNHAEAVTDLGELNYSCQGFVKLIDTFIEVSRKENPWFTTPSVK